MTHCVVLMTSEMCESYPFTNCVMEVRGPYDTRREAEEIAAACPDWTAPHIMQMEKTEVTSCAESDTA